MRQEGRYIDNMDVDGPMPPHIKDVFEGLRYEITWLHAKWAIYSQLFCHGAEQLTFLDSMTPGFFVVIRDSLENDLIVGLCRLTDPSTTGRRENLTLARLKETLNSEEEEEEDLKRVFDLRLEKIDRTCSPFREWRNRRLAHTDFPTALGQSQTPLPGVAWEAIDAALRQVGSLMNLVQIHFLDSEFDYRSFTDLNDGEEVVFYLREAQRYEEEERMRVLGK
ncbi:MAG: hypothetical protein WAM82_30405 [Thermoanaerobaculia bacterium]